MKYCPYCGKITKPTAKFCSACGSALPQAQASNDVQAQQFPIWPTEANSVEQTFSDWQQPLSSPPPTVLASNRSQVAPTPTESADIPVFQNPPALAPYETCADNGPRIGAYLVDSVVVATGGILITLLFFPLITLTSDESVALILTITLTVLVLLWSIGYYTYFHSTSGQTLGKKVFGLKVLRMDGTPLTWQRSLGRAVAFLFIPTLLSCLTCGIGWFVNFLPLVQSEHRALHDLLADTWVIQE